MSNAKRGPRIILIYAAFGPPIGGLLVWLHLFAASLASDVLSNERTALTAGYILAWGYAMFAIPLLAYLFGGMQAFITGCLLKWALNAFGGVSYLHATLAPGFAGALVGVWIVWDGGAPVDNTRISWALYLAGIGVASSLLVRYFFRRRLAPVAGADR